MKSLTPDAPSGFYPVRLNVPDTLLPHLIGAIALLWDDREWLKFGSLSIDATLQMVGELIQSMQVGGLEMAYPVFTGTRVAYDGSQVYSGKWDYFRLRAVEALQQAGGFAIDVDDTHQRIVVPEGAEGLYMAIARYEVASLPSEYSWNAVVLVNQNVEYCAVQGVSNQYVGNGRGFGYDLIPLYTGGYLEIAMNVQVEGDWQPGNCLLHLIKIGEIPQGM